MTRVQFPRARGNPRRAPDVAGESRYTEAMNVPLMFFFTYLVLGMITTVMLWSHMEDEIDLAIGMEDEEIHGPLRIFLMVVFVLAWPIVLWDVVRRS